ncbi:unnamed protein product, partial [Phaeothamnion confervicola]
MDVRSISWRVPNEVGISASLDTSAPAKPADQLVALSNRKEGDSDIAAPPATFLRPKGISESDRSSTASTAKSDCARSKQQSGSASGSGGDGGGSGGGSSDASVALWGFLFRNVNRAVDELYYFGEAEETARHCQEAAELLDSC